ncbi:MAG: hypothetical protein WBD27_08430 [Pyrinomonadaceae bacterium]
MNTTDPQFWTMISTIIIAVCFIAMAVAMIAIAITIKKAAASANRVEESLGPLIDKLNLIGVQGKEISVSFNEVTANLSTATRYLAESTELIKEEVIDLRHIVNSTALTARDKVELVSRTIDRTQMQVTSTTDFVQAKIVEPAREIAAVMAGVKKGLEVLFAPSPKQIDRVYVEEEMFIG